MRSFALLVGACIACLAVGRVGAASETTVETLRVGDEARSYRLHLPAKGDGPYPIVFSFHGFNSNAEQEERLSQFSALADREGFIAVYPEGVDARWRFMGRSDADVLLTAAIIDKLAADHRIDRQRIYATGISNGAQMAWRLAPATGRISSRPSASFPAVTSRSAASRRGRRSSSFTAPTIGCCPMTAAAC